jgi:hypothetical protein
MRNTSKAWVALTLALIASIPGAAAQAPLTIPSRIIAGPAPLTGLVLWSDNPAIAAYSKAIALEFKYFRYDEVASGRPETGFSYDWTTVHAFLDRAASRGHHGVVRFRDTDPQFSNSRIYGPPYLGQPGVPASVRGLVRTAVYNEGIEGAKPVKILFPDWSSRRLGDFVIDFFRHFSSEFKGKPEAPAFVEVGFGLWGEYHLDFDNLSAFSDSSITSIDTAVGKIFPSKADQTRMLIAIDSSLGPFPWSVSIDAADDQYSPFSSQPRLKALSFGLFDDSILSEDPEGHNRDNWKFFGKGARSPNGGEISYYSYADQAHAFDPRGPHGRSLADEAKTLGLSFLVADGQTAYRSPSEIAAAGKSLGYRLAIRTATSSATGTIVTIENTGTAAVFFDIFASMGSVRGEPSLRGLAPGAENAVTVRIPASGKGSDFSLVSDRLLPGQVIPFSGN